MQLIPYSKCGWLTDLGPSHFVLAPVTVWVILPPLTPLS